MKGAAVFGLVELLTPDGNVIAVPPWVRNQVRRRGLLKWNREAWLWQISPLYCLSVDLLESGGVDPAPCRASDPGRTRTSPKKGGRVDPLVKYLGADGCGP